MANNALALRMKYRKFTAEQLNEIIENENSSELEVKVAQEFLDKLGGETAQEEEAPKKAPAKKVAEKKADKKAAPKKAAKEEAAEDPDPEDGSPEAAMKRQNKRNSTYQSEEQLTPEEEERLAKAEAEYEERQKNRKTPSKSDKSMKDKTPRETKRQNLEESEEIPGLKVGSKVILKGEDAVGEITRLYKSGDGKEKCMVKFGDDKPIKKRVTALELAEDAKPAPAKKNSKEEVNG